MSCSALIWRSQCAPLWRKKRDNKMFPGKTSVVLAGIHQCLGLQVKHLHSVSSLLPQKQGGWHASDASSVAVIGRGGKHRGMASLAMGTWRSSVETQWKLVFRAWYVLGGALVCTIQPKCTVRAGSGPLCTGTSTAQPRSSTTLQLKQCPVLSGLRCLSKGCCIFFVTLKSLLDMRLRQQD